MNQKEKTTRFTMDLPTEMHKRLKMICALQEKSMREVIIQAIEEEVKKVIKESNESA